MGVIARKIGKRKKNKQAAAPPPPCLGRAVDSCWGRGFAVFR